VLDRGRVAAIGPAAMLAKRGLLASQPSSVSWRSHG